MVALARLGYLKSPSRAVRPRLSVSFLIKVETLKFELYSVSLYPPFFDLRYRCCLVAGLLFMTSHAIFPAGSSWCDSLALGCKPFLLGFTLGWWFIFFLADICVLVSLMDRADHHARSPFILSPQLTLSTTLLRA
jgi:hypothetical protein